MDFVMVSVVKKPADMLIISVSTTAQVYAPRSASNSQAAGRL